MIKTIRAILIGKSYRLIRLGIGLSICFLIFDLLFDVFYFREADILESIFTPSPYEIYMRFSVIVLVLIFSAYVQVITGHLETNQSKLEQELIERKRAEEALRAAKNLLDKTFASLADAVLVVEPKTRTIIACNAAVEHIFGYAEKDVIGRTTEFMHVDRSWFDRFGRELFSALDGAGVFHAEFQMRRKDGSVFPTENTITEIKDELEQRACVVSVVRDITERKRAEEEIKRYLARFQALHQIDNAISGSVGLRITLNVFLEHATTQLGVDAADVLVLNPHTQLLDYAAARGFSTPALQHTHLRVGDGLAGRAALERKTIAISDLNRDINGLARSPSIQSEGFVSYYGVPLIAKGSVNGVLEVFRRTPIPVDQEWKDFLEMMAGQAAIAIESEQLFENLQRSNVDLALAYDATIEGWSRALDLRDKETEGHTQRVTEITMRLAKAMGIGDAELVHIRRGGLLHDIGKMGVPDSILLKPDKLTDEEWVLMRKHPEYAYNLLSPIAYLKPALDIPYCHHEKWDGTGYPRGLKGEAIPLSARIFAIVDVWDALRSDRPYREAWDEEKVREHIQSLSGTHFDPNVVQAFLRLMEETLRDAREK